jgi:hypothetical protein
MDNVVVKRLSDLRRSLQVLDRIIRYLIASLAEILGGD